MVSIKYYFMILSGIQDKPAYVWLTADTFRLCNVEVTKSSGLHVVMDNTHNSLDELSKINGAKPTKYQ